MGDVHPPCPFCGEPGVFALTEDRVDDAPFWYVDCSQCGATGPVSDTELLAWQAWDTRFVDTLYLPRILQAIVESSREEVT